MSEIQENAAPAVTKELPVSGYGLVSIVIGAIFFGSMLVFVLNAGIIVSTSDTGILDTKEIVGIIYSYLVTGGPASILGIAFGVAGVMQKDRSKVLPYWGLVINFINLNGAVLCMVILNIDA